jgi:hypothetical protein
MTQKNPMIERNGKQTIARCVYFKPKQYLLTKIQRLDIKKVMLPWLDQGERLANPGNNTTY